MFSFSLKYMAFKIYCIFIFSPYIPSCSHLLFQRKQTAVLLNVFVRSQFLCLLPVECDRRPIHPSPETTVVFTTKVVSSSDLCCVGIEMGGVLSSALCHQDCTPSSYPPASWELPCSQCGVMSLQSVPFQSHH